MAADEPNARQQPEPLAELDYVAEVILYCPCCVAREFGAPTNDE
jgi:hypothetical protein